MQFSLTMLALREKMYKSMKICLCLILKLNFNRSVCEYRHSGACSAKNVTENFRGNPKLTVSDLHVRSSKDVSLGKCVFWANETEILQSIWICHECFLSKWLRIQTHFKVPGRRNGNVSCWNVWLGLVIGNLATPCYTCVSKPESRCWSETMSTRNRNSF